MLASPTRPDIAYRTTGFRGFDAFTELSVFRDLFHELNAEKTIELSGSVRSGPHPKELSISLQANHGNIEPLQGGSNGNTGGVTNLPRPLSAHELAFDYRSEEGDEYRTRGIWAEEIRVLGPTRITETIRGVYPDPQHNVANDPATFINAKGRTHPGVMASNFGSLQMVRNEDLALGFLKTVGPKVSGLIPITVGDDVILHALLEGQSTPMPINMLGEGGFRALEISLAIASMKGGAVLIDEIENGLHHSVLHSVFERLHNLADYYDVQVFATTHSLECVKAAREALGPAGDRFTYHRIGSRDGKARAVYYDDDMLRTAFELGLEIR